jgi:hypothetical protein
MKNSGLDRKGENGNEGKGRKNELSAEKGGGKVRWKSKRNLCNNKGNIFFCEPHLRRV